jgi:hypothetical protein
MPQNHLQNVSLKAFQDHVVTGVLLTLGARLERLRKTDQNKVTRPLPDHPEPWGPCVVRGPVHGHLLVWWVIDNVVWTDSWLSIAGAGCGLTRVGAGEEQAWKVVAGEASQLWRGQVGLVRGTRWQAGSSTGRMVARTARWSHGQFLGWASKPRSSRDFVGAKSWVVISGSYIKFAGFAVVHQETIRLLNWATKPRPKPGVAFRPKPPDWFGVAGRWKLRGGGHASGSQVLRRGYARSSRRASVQWCYKDKFPKCPWRRVS